MSLRLAVIATALAFALPMPVLAQEPPGYTAPFPESLEARVFPLLAFLRKAPGWAEALAADRELQRLTQDRAARVPAEGCTPAPECLAQAWTLTDADIELVDARLQVLVARPALARALVRYHLRPSGRFARYGALTDGALLSAAWHDAARGLNRTIAVYGLGQAPMYPKIDAIIFDTANPEYPGLLVRHGVATVALGREGDLFFDPVLRYAAGLMMINERTEGAAFRPLLDGENADALRAARSIDWQDYRYPALLVFGHGPEDPQSGTGPMAHIRLRLAADMFARGLAPYIVVSGGNVHPNRTKSNEAVEMRRLLTTLHGVPAERILIEPHARHTTTNLRNVARLLLAAGFPVDRPSLIVSDHVTIGYIAGSELAARNLREMGVQPGKVMPGPDRFTALFTPDPIAFHVEVSDPLDP
jgi:hypothetical protein